MLELFLFEQQQGAVTVLPCEAAARLRAMSWFLNHKDSAQSVSYEEQQALLRFDNKWLFV